MKRLIMRAFWGINDRSHRLLNRKFRVDSNIQTIAKNKFNAPFVTYVWGKDNYEGLKSLGFDCVLLHPEPFQWDLIKFQYRHKLEALRYAMEVEKCDELLHVDWDCIPKKKADENMWNLLGKKESFQANLITYRHVKAKWRKKDNDGRGIRTIPNGGCVYIRDKTIPFKLIEIWETMKGPSAEPPMAKYLDDITGGWCGIEKYWDLFEIPICNPYRKSSYLPEKLKTKDTYFTHFLG